ncbi:MAG: sn-glycerol-1-phosphate dehydrogenase [Anaerolineae bacterium]|nr:sn-glycerol-1-phosphate dehydrogenase [Anaerolineae bacterium]
MSKIDPIYVGKDATGKMLEYVAAHGLKRFALVADTNTYAALGQHVEQALKAQGYEVHSVVLEGEHIHTDEHQIVQVLIRAPLGPCTFIAVGSGTITDITRFCSHRSGRQFIGMPTAPSVDGFTSIGAPIILAGVKTTIVCQPPMAVFADIDTLCNAPQRLVAAGFGDMIGKITSLADWNLGRLLWDEPYDTDIAARSQVAIDSVMSRADAIGQRTEEGVRALMDALIESGLCMLDFGATRPASGAEHHISHYWEMVRLWEGRESMLHGAQVGYALTLVARQYERVRAIDRAELMNRLEAATLPDRATEIANIRAGYREMSPKILIEQAPFLDLTEADYDNLKHKIADNWDEIQSVAETVPEPSVIIDALRKAGGPADYEALGLDADEVTNGLHNGHYLRNRFTVAKLSHVIDLPMD